MVRVFVSQLKNGAILQEDVFTARGSLLFNKGSTIGEREIEILKAFQIKSVLIQAANNQENASAGIQPRELNENERLFQGEYNVMLSLLKKAFKDITVTNELPVLDIRHTLEALVSRIKNYNILSFHPSNWKIEDQLYHKSIKVSLSAYMIAKWHGMESKDLIPVAMGGLLHDIGNVKIDKHILQKPSLLTKEEKAIIQQHPVEGYNLLKDIAGLNEGVKLCALQHHEREDGSGYPFRIKGDRIHTYAKIIAVADIYHAMTSQRFHKDPISPYVVLEQLFDESFGKLDPSLVQTFINQATQFSKGTIVRLNDGNVGEIIFTEINDPTRPWVSVNDTIINLSIERHLYIDKVIRGHS